jgi:hypothetical protein
MTLIANTPESIPIGPDKNPAHNSYVPSTTSPIERSFEFLSARESNRSILLRFDLAVIGRYFPEYETAIREKLT